MQTNLKFNTITFFKPVIKSKDPKIVHAMISISPTGKGTNNNHYFYLNNLILEERLKWSHVRIGHEDGNLYLTSGNEENGFKLSVNNTINSKELISTIFKMYNIVEPNEITKKIKIRFTFQKIDNDMYLLKKI
jgi:hypothetical protein